MGPHDGISALIKRDTRELLLSLSVPHENTERWWQPSPEPDPAGALTLDLQSYEKINVKPPSLWYLLQ